MTIEKLKEINEHANDLANQKDRVKILHEARDAEKNPAVIGRYEAFVYGTVFGFHVAFEREHFEKFLDVEILRAENAVKRLSEELEAM